MAIKEPRYRMARLMELYGDTLGRLRQGARFASTTNARRCTASIRRK
jgi:hypothetical protein